MTNTTNKAESYLSGATATPKPQAVQQGQPQDTCENVLELRKVSMVYKGTKPSKFWGAIARLKAEASPILLPFIVLVISVLATGVLLRSHAGSPLAIFIMWAMVLTTIWSGVKLVAIIRGKSNGSFINLDFIDSLAEGVPDVTVLKDVDLVVPNKAEGEFVVLIGPSGCGKSTLLRFFANLAVPTSGEVFVNGLNTNSWLIRLGMVFQEYSSFPWMTVLDNVALGLKYQGVNKKERHAQAMKMIQRVGLSGHELKYARKPTLSGGQLQRVAIARSLLANPQVLLLDEPFGALDVKVRAQLQDLLCSIFEEYKPTIVLVTHDINEAVYLADVIYIMSKPPANIAHQVKVDLGFHRDRKTKRTPEFIRLTQQVEDLMMAMEI